MSAASSATGLTRGFEAQARRQWAEAERMREDEASETIGGSSPSQSASQSRSTSCFGRCWSVVPRLCSAIDKRFPGGRQGLAVAVTSVALVALTLIGLATVAGLFLPPFAVGVVVGFPTGFVVGALAGAIIK
ncbi:MAG: hypothetical protein JSS61_07170 [Verrucomicrobia bacterium]|nr:hypothetical protein [Verrucomicrobiota bacterium]